MTYTTEDGERVHLRLMDQLRPHIVNVAIALKFPLHTGRGHDNPVGYLLSEWLRGANRELDPRPVTWRTLIEALRDANCQEEADILDQYLIESDSHDTETPGIIIIGYYYNNYYDEM